MLNEREQATSPWSLCSREDNGTNGLVMGRE
jgi:hypothetical protein